MKANIKFFIFLLLIYLALAGLAYFIVSLTSFAIGFRDLSILLTGGFIITVISFLIFLKGSSKNEGKPVIYTLLSIGLKFILYLALLGIYALISGNLSIPFLVSFFVIYLSFTSYLLLTFVSLLKSKKQTVSNGKEN